nr:hypothetical protein [Pseudophaeobacter sp. EL27]
MLRTLSVLGLALGLLPSGAQAAPFTTAAEVKPILAATRANWVSVREYEGQDLLYVTHLWSWRCGLDGMRIGVNGAEPVIWPMPPCHEDQAAPNAILSEDGLPYGVFPLGSIQQITIDVFYDDRTMETLKVNRLGQPISP